MDLFSFYILSCRVGIHSYVILTEIWWIDCNNATHDYEINFNQNTYTNIQSYWSAQEQVFHCKLGILHTTLFSAFLFLYSYSPFIIRLSIIWYILLPRTFFPFTIPSRASFSRQFLLSQWPSQFLSIFFISFSILLPSPTLSSTTALFLFCLSILQRSIFLHVHIWNASSRFCSFCNSVLTSALCNATLHTRYFTSPFRSFFFQGSAENASLPVESSISMFFSILSSSASKAISLSNFMYRESSSCYVYT